MNLYHLADYHKLLHMVRFPLEVVKAEFEKMGADPRCNIGDVLDGKKWPDLEGIHGSGHMLRMACAAVLLSRMSGYHTRGNVRYSHGFLCSTVVIIVEKNYS